MGTHRKGSSLVTDHDHFRYQEHMDPEIHKEYTGVTNDRILANLKRLTEEERELILRIPVIPHVNDDKKNMEATADFIRQ